MNMVKWMKQTIMMKEMNQLVSKTNLCDSVTEDEFKEEETFKNYAINVEDADHQEVDTVEVANEQKHSTKNQQCESSQSLKKFKKSFSGKLGECSKRKIHLEVDEAITPTHSRPYSTARTHLEAFKKELQHLEKLDF